MSPAWRSGEPTRKPLHEDSSPTLRSSCSSARTRRLVAAYSANHPGRADYTSGFLHSATITKLLPSKTYYYVCGDETRAMSTVRSFITPAKIGADQPVTLGILGDLGQTSYSE